MPSVFVSHAFEDRNIVETRIIQPLQRNGFRTWSATHDIKPPMEWEPAIRKALGDCDWVLVALSPASVRSPWVQAEVRFAFELRRPVVPVLLEPCDPAECSLRLSAIQYLDLRDPGTTDQRLLEAFGVQPLRDQPKASPRSARARAWVEPLKARRLWAAVAFVVAGVYVYSRSTSIPIPERESVRLVAPPDGGQHDLTVSFAWEIRGRHTNVTYCSELLTDKGRNPFDGGFESVFFAGEDTDLTVQLSPSRYVGATFEWGVRVTACTEPTVTCRTSSPPCGGRQLTSDIRRLRMN